MSALWSLAAWVAASCTAAGLWGALCWLVDQRPVRPIDRRSTVHRPRPIPFTAYSNPHRLGHATWHVSAPSLDAAWHALERVAS